MLALAGHKLRASSNHSTLFPTSNEKKKKRSNNNFGILEEYDDWCISMGNSWHVIKSMNTNYH